jgi:HSP20 family molecular chaperone IbpA
MTLQKPALLRDIFDDIFNLMLNDTGFSLTGFTQHVKPASFSIPSYPVSSYAVAKDGSTKLEVALTGFDEKEIDVSLSDDVLTIKASKNDGDKETWSYVYNNVATRDIDVSFKLSPNMDLEKITTTYVNGLLTVKFPVKFDEKKIRKIELNTSREIEA